jgi:pre-mRNA-splicing factor 18
MDELKAEVERKRAERAAKQATVGLHHGVSMGTDSHRLTTVGREAPPVAAPALDVGEGAAPSDRARIVAEGLRSMGLPVRLFGESDALQSQRFVAAGGTCGGACAPALLAGSPPAAAAGGTAAGAKRRRAESEDERVVARKVEASDGVPEEGVRGGEGVRETFRHTAAAEFRSTSRSDARAGDKYVYKCFRGLLHEWEAALSARPPGSREDFAYRSQVRMLGETEEHLRPFFKMLKHGELPVDIKGHCMEVVDGILDREYRRAGDAYIRLAVGNAQWIIGVSQVGLHERAAREKVYLGKIAHVMNDETQRLYIVSLKRLLSYIQEASPADPSKMLLNK